MGLFGGSKSSSSSTTNVDSSNLAAQDQGQAVRGNNNVVQNFDPGMYRDFINMTTDQLDNNLVAQQLNLEAGLTGLGYAHSMIESALDVARESSQSAQHSVAAAYSEMSRPVAPAPDYTNVLIIGGGFVLAALLIYKKG